MTLPEKSLQVRQQASFSVSSTRVTAAEMTAALGMRPDQAIQRGSKRADPPLPAFHSWVVAAAVAGLDLSEQVDVLIERLRPITGQLAALAGRIRQDPDDYAKAPQIAGGAGLSVVRYFHNGVALGGLGLHVSAQTIEFLGQVGASLGLDEYDDREYGPFPAETRL